MNRKKNWKKKFEKGINENEGKKFTWKIANVSSPITTSTHTHREVKNKKTNEIWIRNPESKNVFFFFGFVLGSLLGPHSNFTIHIKIYICLHSPSHISWILMSKNILNSIACRNSKYLIDKGRFINIQFFFSFLTDVRHNSSDAINYIDLQFYIHNFIGRVFILELPKGFSMVRWSGKPFYRSCWRKMWNWQNFPWFRLFPDFPKI